MKAQFLTFISHVFIAHAQDSMWHKCSEVRTTYETICDCDSTVDNPSNLRRCTQTPVTNGPATLIIKGTLTQSDQDKRNVIATAYGAYPYYDVSTRGEGGLVSQITSYYNKDYTTFWTRGTTKNSNTFYYMKASWWSHATAYGDVMANASPMTNEIFNDISQANVFDALTLGEQHLCSDEVNSAQTCFNGLNATERLITTPGGHTFDAMHFVGGSWWRRNYPHTEETLFVATAADAVTYTPEWLTKVMLICTAINSKYGAGPLVLTIAEPDSSGDYNSCI
jgi:hypothetical protein